MSKQNRSSFDMKRGKEAFLLLRGAKEPIDGDIGQVERDVAEIDGGGLDKGREIERFLQVI
jgi:hypothetical protein